MDEELELELYEADNDISYRKITYRVIEEATDTVVIPAFTAFVGDITRWSIIDKTRTWEVTRMDVPNGTLYVKPY